MIFLYKKKTDLKPVFLCENRNTKHNNHSGQLKLVST